MIDKNNLDVSNYEIIVVGKCNVEGIKIISFDETKKRNWITKKKNLITENSKYENIVFIHDYIEFCDGWYEGMLSFPQDFDILTNKILNIHGKRFRDWCLFTGFLAGCYNVHKHKNCDEIIKTGCLLPYEMISNEKLNKYIYLSGQYFIVKKEVMIKYPLNENLVWAHGEDVEWCERVSNEYLFKFNKNSTVKLMKEKNEPDWQKECKIELL